MHYLSFLQNKQHEIEKSVNFGDVYHTKECFLSCLKVKWYKHFIDKWDFGWRISDLSSLSYSVDSYYHSACCHPDVFQNGHLVRLVPPMDKQTIKMRLESHPVAYCYD